eukprot:972114-Pleurochrysis_carterae.AAC.8
MEAVCNLAAQQDAADGKTDAAFRMRSLLRVSSLGIGNNSAWCAAGAQEQPNLNTCLMIAPCGKLPSAILVSS